MDYIWDFGTLDSRDERSYIASIMSNTFNAISSFAKALLVDVVSDSQSCITQINVNSYVIMI